MSRAAEEYDDISRSYELVIFDVRVPDAKERFDSERAAWAERGDVEMMDFDHPILIIRAGGALRLQR